MPWLFQLPPGHQPTSQGVFFDGHEGFTLKIIDCLNILAIRSAKYDPAKLGKTIID